MEEVEALLKGFAKDKILVPDGWIVDFFSSFLDIVGGDILDVVEQSRVEGYVSRPFNASFLTLIPKCEKHVTFVDYRPISLSILVYKVIT